MLKKEGKGKSNAAEPLETRDQVQRYCKYSMVLANLLHLGLRGRDEHYKLMYGDFSIHSTSDGFKYVEFNERDTKHVQVSLIHAANSSPKCGAHLTIPLGALYVFLKLFFISVLQKCANPYHPFIWP